MPNQWELLGTVAHALQSAARELTEAMRALPSNSSSAALDAICSLTDTTASGGDGSVKGTTGLTAAGWAMFRTGLVQMLHVEAFSPEAISTVLGVVESLRFYLDSYASASGGEPSQPRLSDARPDNWPGASSDPTRPAATSAPTTTRTRIDWNEVRRTADARAFGSSEKSAERRKWVGHGMDVLIAHLIERYPDL